jgi:hypothetical protein
MRWFKPPPAERLRRAKPSSPVQHRYKTDIPTYPRPFAFGTQQRRFLETPGQIITTGDAITVRLERRAYSDPSSAKPTYHQQPPCPGGATAPYATNSSEPCVEPVAWKSALTGRRRRGGARPGRVGKVGFQPKITGDSRSRPSRLTVAVEGGPKRRPVTTTHSCVPVRRAGRHAAAYRD